uniref:Uncharacterized protein n=1 Tax=Anguilla anguilla TaxID=7936 RepID=A0A0E9P7S5_ANGAN
MPGARQWTCCLCQRAWHQAGRD